MASVYDWSVVAGNNSSSDSGINWAEGQAPGSVNDSARQLMGRVAEILGDLGGALSAGGTANGLTVTANSAFTVLAEGRLISFRATATNSGAATLNVNGIGARSIRKMTATGESALGAGDIQNTGIYVAQYSGALNAAAGGWLLVNPSLSSLTLLDFTLVSTDAGAAAGPVLTFYRNSASPLAGDIIGKTLHQGKDSATNTEDYSETYTTITDPTSTSEDADYLIRTKVGGAMTTHATFGAAGVTIATAFATIGIDDNATTEVLQLADTTMHLGVGTAASDFYVTRFPALATGTLTLAGSTSGTGGGIVRVYGPSHAVNPNMVEFITAGATRGKFTGTSGSFLVGDGSYTGLNIADIGVSIQGAGGSSPGTISLTVGAGVGVAINKSLGNGSAMEFYRIGVLVGSITVSAGATAYNTSSDANLKTDFRPFDSGALVDNLDFGQFEWIEGGETGFGCFAQDAEKVFPNAVSVNKDGMYQADYSKFVPIAMAELKMLRRRIASLERQEG